MFRAGAALAALSRVVVLIPLAALALNVVAYAVYGIDLPFADDWQPYEWEKAGSYNLRDLFAPGNDTIYPVGRFLDAVAQNVLRGNSIAYQLITMVLILGPLLFVQWRLITKVMRDRVAARFVFGLCLLMLQSQSYWGLQNNAYIQGLPILCIMLTLYLVVASRWPASFRLALSFLLSIIGGLSYISGALALIPFALVMLVFAHGADGEERGLLTRAGLVVLAAGLVTTLVQVGFVYLRQGVELHRADARWALPTDADFWLYLLGKAGKSLGLSVEHALRSLAITLVCTAAVSALAVHALVRARHALVRAPDEPTSDGRFLAGMVLCALGSVALLNIALAAAGRAKLRPPEIDTLVEVFQFGFLNRFHFFWPTLVWPWMVAYLALVAGREPGRRRLLAAGLSLLLLAAAIQSGAHRIHADYAGLALIRERELACLQYQANTSTRIVATSRIDCPPVIPADLTRAFVYARKIGVSFTRYVPVIPVPLGEAPGGVLFRLTSPEGQLRPVNAAYAGASAQGWEFRASVDPQLYFNVADEGLRRCLLVQVSARMRLARADVSQLFFVDAGGTGFSEQSSEKVPVVSQGEDMVDVHFLLDSPASFSGQFRFDPVADRQDFAIKEMEVRCRIVDPNR